LDPTGKLHLKEPLFILLLFIALLNGSKSIKIYNGFYLFVLVCLIVPLWGILVATIRSSLEVPDFATGQLKSLLFVLIFYYLVQLKYDNLMRIVFFSGLLMSIIVTIIFVAGQLNESLFVYMYTLSRTIDNMFISKRSYLGVDVLGVYFRTGPLIFFSYYYALYILKKGKLRSLSCLISLFSLLVAGSRMPMLIGILITAIYVLDSKILGRRLTHILFFLCILFIGVSTYLLASDKDEVSNQVKFGNIPSYVQAMSDAPTILIGAGLGSTFYAQGRDKIVTHTEFTFFDILRIYGLIIGSFFILLFFYPVLIIRNSRYWSNLKYKRFAYVYIFYLLIAGTNPLLISSTGMFAVALALTTAYHAKRQSLPL
jgi:hypothetical protein